VGTPQLTSSRSLTPSSNAFFAASSVRSFPVISEWLGVLFSLTLPFSWSSSSLMRYCTERVLGNHSSSLTFRYVNCVDNGSLFGIKYCCLASHLVFHRGFGCDNRVADSLILQGPVREYIQPFVILCWLFC
jgi:hypothetical protein